jgi:putative cardiolipin synthase
MLLRMSWRCRTLFRPVLLPLVLAVAQGCATAPREVEKTASFAPTDTGATFLARSADSLGNPHDGRSGFYLLDNGIEALAVRLILIERAERTIDAQYYLVHNDAAGQLFASRLLDAADRGVRVRLLIDDMDTSGYDAMTAALTRHPNIEIRLFNPFRRGPGRLIASAFEFDRINRRMHNKSMTFDNEVTIVGGRNIGEEYFAAREDSNYDDLDLLAAGPVAKEVSRSFDAYWNSPYAVPAAAVVRDRDAGLSLDEARVRLSALERSARRTEYGAALTHGIRGSVDTGRISLAWVPSKLFVDPPDKAAGNVDDREILISEIRPYVRSARHELAVSSAYFVPGPRGTEFLTGMARSGVTVRILTNSLDSNDVEPVHGHYARYRKDLLEGGVELWELRPDADRPDRDMFDLGQSLSGLHTKAFSIDRRYLFVGSFNWDPRSANINTEMGILLDAPALAREAVQGFNEKLPRAAYRLRLDEAGEIEWLARGEDGVWVAYRDEPSSSAWRRLRTGIYGILPIGGQL